MGRQRPDARGELHSGGLRHRPRRRNCLRHSCSTAHGSSKAAIETETKMKKNKRSTSSRDKAWDQMSVDELRAATRDLDAADFQPHFLKPSGGQKALLTKFMKKARRGRPRMG